MRVRGRRQVRRSRPQWRSWSFARGRRRGKPREGLGRRRGRSEEGKSCRRGWPCRSVAAVSAAALTAAAAEPAQWSGKQRYNLSPRPPPPPFPNLNRTRGHTSTRYEPAASDAAGPGAPPLRAPPARIGGRLGAFLAFYTAGPHFLRFLLRARCNPLGPPSHLHRGGHVDARPYHHPQGGACLFLWSGLSSPSVSEWPYHASTRLYQAACRASTYPLWWPDGPSWSTSCHRSPRRLGSIVSRHRCRRPPPGCRDGAGGCAPPTSRRGAACHPEWCCGPHS